MLTFVIVGKI